MTKETCIALLSGGLDSATATALAIEKGYKVLGLSFDYGQRHRKELKAAKQLSNHFGLETHHIIQVDLSMWGGSALTDKNQKLPSDGVKEGVIPNTYVPGRNTVFIAIGLSLAEATNSKKVILGINAMDYSGYPDCRPDYLDAFQLLANLASKSGREGKSTELWAPLIDLSKVQIMKEAMRLKIPINKTWSCYSGNDEPCGICDSCRIRNEAMKKLNHSNL